MTYLQCCGSNVGSRCLLRRDGEMNFRFVMSVAAIDASLSLSFDSDLDKTRMLAADGKSSISA